MKNKNKNKNKMKPITPQEVFSKEENEKFAKVGKEVIEKINGFLKNRKFTFNDALDKILLTEPQMNTIKKLYEEQGWKVTIFEDNHNTTSVKFEFIQKR